MMMLSVGKHTNRYILHSFAGDLAASAFFCLVIFFFTVTFSIFKFDVVSCTFSNCLWNALVL